MIINASISSELVENVLELEKVLFSKVIEGQVTYEYVTGHKMVDMSTGLEVRTDMKSMNFDTFIKRAKLWAIRNRYQIQENHLCGLFEIRWNKCGYGFEHQQVHGDFYEDELMLSAFEAILKDMEKEQVISTEV